MRDEEGDTGLDSGPQRGSLGGPSPAGNQAPPPTLRQYRCCFVALGAGCITLTLAVIVLSRVGLQGCSKEHQTMQALRGPDVAGNAQRSGNGAEGNCSVQDFRSHLRQSLCELPQSLSAEGTGCKLCPRLWVPHRDKCYWLSKDHEFWSRAQEDCSRRRSQLLVIQDLEEKEFIQNITQNQNHVWIGLNITSRERNWIWVDRSPLNQTLFTVSGPVEKNSCAALQNNQIHSEICDTDYKWICQKASVLI